MQTDADEIRQAICKNPDGKFILATFATDRGQREWINGAKDYGGFYLVGRKWVAVGHEDVVASLRGRAGRHVGGGDIALLALLALPGRGGVARRTRRLTHTKKAGDGNSVTGLLHWITSAATGSSARR